jgi:methylthioribose-1-phosphate isomerase
LEYIYPRTIDELAEAIRSLKVRGAPAIGVTAAYGLAMAANTSDASNPLELLDELEAAANTLRETRPTAVNLPWALATVLVAAKESAGDVASIKHAVKATAQRIDSENREANRRMGEHGAAILSTEYRVPSTEYQAGDTRYSVLGTRYFNVLTHCNTGPLAAGGIGSALGIIYTIYKQGKPVHVWVDETRPVLQGARLTTWELGTWGVPHTLIADNMAASLMRAGRVDAVLVGADRIAANGDVANKIGTYGLATLAHAHKIPFYVAAPTSTIDTKLETGEQIRIEERHPDELTHHGGNRIAPEGTAAYNPAFDVTPFALISGIITELGLMRPPFE